MAREPKIGDVVVYHDEKGVGHNALIICVWGHPEEYVEKGCLNMVIVNSDPSMDDSYGRQIVRPTSIPHGSRMPVHGNYWRWPDEKPNPYVEPAAK